jgi:RHS repeat-associated protein
VTTNYGYDAIYQLLSASQGNSTTESYTYDPVGNRTASLGVSSYSNNTSNELTSTSNTSYTHDANGNTLTSTTSSNTTTYTWDFENRLTSVTLPGSGGTVTFQYDPFGRRIYKQSPTATSIFAYDGDNLVETVNSSGGVVARYTLTQNIDEPLAELRSGTTSYYEADGLGSITSLTSSAGAVANTYTYDSFGNLTASTGTLSNPFRYTAREFDVETNLYFNRARYYDPFTGRFLSEDPITFRGGVNFYSYVGGDPVDLVDPGGNDYHVSLEGNTIVVSASVTIYGPSASNELARSWQNDVNQYWNAGNFHFGKCNVHFDVKFFADPGHNWRWTASPKSDNYVNVIPQKGDEHILDETWSSYGRWLSGLVDQDVAHSMGHFFHLGDDYSLLFGTRKAHAGHMMSNDVIRNVAQHEVDDVIKGQLPPGCGCK